MTNALLPYLTRASQLGDAAGDTIGGAIVSVAGLFAARRPAAEVKADNSRGVVPYQGPLPPNATALYHDALGAVGVEEDAKPAVNAIVAARNEQHGYNADAKNFGGLRCLLAHEHGTDSQCIKCTSPDGGTTFLRCHGSDREALERLVRVARATTLAAPVAPLCPQCGKHDAEPAPAVVEPGSQPLEAAVHDGHAAEGGSGTAPAADGDGMVTHGHDEDEGNVGFGADDCGGVPEGLAFRIAPRARLDGVLTPAQRATRTPAVLLLQAGKLSRGQMEQLVNLGAITPVPPGRYKPTRFRMRKGRVVVAERASLRSDGGDDLGGWALGAAIAAPFIALLIAAGAAKIEANRLVKGLREKGIEIRAPRQGASRGDDAPQHGFRARTRLRLRKRARHVRGGAREHARRARAQVRALARLALRDARPEDEGGREGRGAHGCRRRAPVHPGPA